MKTITLEKFLPEKKVFGKEIYYIPRDDVRNELINQCAKVELCLDHDAIIRIASEYFVELGLKIKTGNPNENVSPARGLADKLCEHAEIICAAKTVDNPVKN